MGRDMDMSEQKPDYFYNTADWDCTHHDMGTLLDSADPRRGEMLRIGRLVEIEPIFTVRLPDPDDEDGDIDKEFATEAEALAAIAEYKAKEANL